MSKNLDDPEDVLLSMAKQEPWNPTRLPISGPISCLKPGFSKFDKNASLSMDGSFLPAMDKPKILRVGELRRAGQDVVGRGKTGASRPRSSSLCRTVQTELEAEAKAKQTVDFSYLFTLSAKQLADGLNMENYSKANVIKSKHGYDEPEFQLYSGIARREYRSNRKLGRSQ